MRKSNQCFIDVDGGTDRITAYCGQSYLLDCIYAKTGKNGACRWKHALPKRDFSLWTYDCKNKEATNEAATKLVKKLRQRFGTND